MLNSEEWLTRVILPVYMEKNELGTYLSDVPGGWHGRIQKN